MDHVPDDSRRMVRHGKPVRVTGSVVEGVEHGSVVLVTVGGPTYQLGRAWRHLVGRRVVVTGRSRADMSTTAQQGTPFTVVDVEDLGPSATPPTAV